MSNKLGITELVLRDAHQSLLATRMRIDDMLPIADKLDQVGYWSIESWGGATFDACIRFLGEDPWERIRRLKEAMPNTPQQMLFRGQNILGYRHYADDVVVKFVERAAANGVDIFRIFDAMNDMRNLQTAVKATLAVGRHAQGTISYTVSPAHTMDLWVELGKRIEDMGADSIAIKDMAGLLKPYAAFELVSRLKESLAIPIHMQCHATTGMSMATYIKAIEAGIDNVDTAISSMSMTYGHSPTEAIVAILEDTDRDTVDERVRQRDDQRERHRQRNAVVVAHADQHHGRCGDLCDYRQVQVVAADNHECHADGDDADRCGAVENVGDVGDGREAVDEYRGEEQQHGGENEDSLLGRPHQEVEVLLLDP